MHNNIVRAAAEVYQGAEKAQEIKMVTNCTE